MNQSLRSRYTKSVSNHLTTDTLGAADDALEANDTDCLSFDQARAKALETASLRKAERRAASLGPITTIKSVVENYCDYREAREAERTGIRPRRRDARDRLTKYVLKSDIAEIGLSTLTEDDLKRWRKDLPDRLAGETVKRLLNDFRAALNHGVENHRASLPAAMPLIIKNGLKAGQPSPPVARDGQALSDAEIRRVISAAKIVDTEDGWDGDLERIVIVLAATGARFGQVSRLRVVDVQGGHNRIMVPPSHKGRGAKQASHVAVRVGEDVVAALVPVIAGRRGSEILLERWRHRQVAGTTGRAPEWIRDRRGPWFEAAELARPWRHIARTAGLPVDVVAYSLRHSSIVRQLRAGLPVQLVARLHDTSPQMVSAHYSAAIVDALDALTAAAIIPLIATDSRN